MGGARAGRQRVRRVRSPRARLACRARARARASPTAVTFGAPPHDALTIRIDAASPRRAPRQATDDESPFRPYPSRPSRPTWITFGAGPDFTLYLEQVTVAPGVRAGVTVDAFRAALGAFAMNVSNRLGSSTYGGATVSLGARAEWPLGRTLVFDAELAVGYDAGPSFQAGGDTVAALRGIRAGLLLTLAARL